MRNEFLTPKAVKDMEEVFALKREAVELLGIISSEFESDPMSVQCFDLRIVERAKYVTARLKKLDVFGGA
jgi:hypothetical protein